MRKLILLFISIALAGVCHAQNFGFAKSIGGPDHDETWSVTTDAAGNFYASGDFGGTGDFDPGPGTYNMTAGGSSADVFVLKLDASGNFVWARSFGSVEHDLGKNVKVDASGNVYVMGSFKGTVDFDPGSGVSNLTSGNSGSMEDLFLVKLNASGNFVWAVQRQASNPWDVWVHNSSDLELDASGNIYMTYGFSDVGSSTLQVLIEKAGSATGAAIWVKHIDVVDMLTHPSFQHGRLMLDNSGNIFLTGSFEGEVDFDPNGTNSTIAPYGGLSGYVLKLTNAGSFVWVKALEAEQSATIRVHDAAMDAAGNIFLGGEFTGIVDFDPASGTQKQTALSTSNAFIAKLDAAGNYQWANQYGIGQTLNVTYALATDAYGSVYGTGYFMDTITFGTPPNTVTFGKAKVNQFEEGFVVKLTSNGDLGWARQMGGGAGFMVESYTVHVGSNGMVYAGGRFWEPANFNVPKPGGDILTPVNNGTDAFILAAEGCSPVDISVSVSGSTLTAAATGVSYQWINCATKTPVPGATGKTFTPAATGSYAVVATNPGCGSDTSICLSVKGTGLEDVQRELASIYPNPTDGNISIQLDKNYSNIEVEITSAIGAVVSKKSYSNMQSINTNLGGAAGIYFISITANGEVIAPERVVKGK